MPALTVTISIAGKEGETSSLPFGDPRSRSRNSPSPTGRSGCSPQSYPQPAPAPPNPAAPTTSNRKTFDFGPLKPGADGEAVWKLSAVRAGKYTLLYSVDAGLSGNAKAKTDGGVAPGGSFAVEISRTRRRTPKSPTAAKSSK